MNAKDFRLGIIGITIPSLLILIIHILRPDLAIDNITLILFLIATIPFLSLSVKSIKFGGVEIDLQSMKELIEKADKAGLLAATEGKKAAALAVEGKKKDLPKYSFQLVADQDPNLALAGLRIEIEKRLFQLAGAFGIDARRSSIGVLLRELSQKGVLSPQESGVLADLVPLLNSAVHGAQIDKSAAEWVIWIGSGVLISLDKKIKK